MWVILFCRIQIHLIGYFLLTFNDWWNIFNNNQNAKLIIFTLNLISLIHRKIIALSWNNWIIITVYFFHFKFIIFNLFHFVNFIFPMIFLFICVEWAHSFFVFNITLLNVIVFIHIRWILIFLFNFKKQFAECHVFLNKFIHDFIEIIFLENFFVLKCHYCIIWNEIRLINFFFQNILILSFKLAKI